MGKLSNNLVACWLFEQSEGNVAHDYSGNGNHGTITGAISRIQKGAHWSLRFDQVSTQYVNVPNVPELQIASAGTWIWQTSIIRNNRVGLGLLGHGSGVSTQLYNRFYLASTQSRITFETCNRTDGHISRKTGYLSNGDVTAVHQFAYTYDGNYERLYIDGIKKCEIARTGSIQTGNSDLNIGRKAHSRRWQFYGDLDLCAVWDRTLNDDEISEVFNDPYGIVRRDGVAFHHLSGITTQGAADPIADWFATFEAWISGVVGWTVVSGAGTTDLVLNSTGEAGLYTKLYVRVWRDGVTTHVRGEVRDDAIGTHQTNEAGYLDIPCQNRFWMSADLDCIILVMSAGYYDRILYLGIVEPMANNPADETYHMVATSSSQHASILRNSAGVWDVDITNYCENIAANLSRCGYDESYTPPPLFADRQNTCAGQYKYLSARIGTPSISPHDELTSNVAGALSKWKVFSGITWSFAIMIEGTPPDNVADGAHFAHQTGPIALAPDFIINILPPFMVAIGWQDLGDVGVDSVCRLFYSTGESGLDHIYIIVSYVNAAQRYWLYVQDDAVGTHRTAGNVRIPMTAASFPATYFMTADRDCLVFTFDNYFGTEMYAWVGKLAQFNPNLPDATYSMGAAARFWSTYAILRGHDGVWNPPCAVSEPVNIGLNSNANAYDANTYIVFPQPLVTHRAGVAGTQDPVGDLRYCMYTSGAGIAYPDTISVGARTYQIFSGSAGRRWAMRTT